MTTDGPLPAIDAATARLLRSVEAMADDTLAGPSLLPGWTRGHVLAHVARNADGLVNLLTWARTGVETPQYPSQEVRDADIEAGAGRPRAEHLDDLRASAARFRAAAQTLPEDRREFRVRVRGGRTLPARDLVWARLREVEIHHVDLDAGYAPADWPRGFVQRLLPEVAADVTEGGGAGFAVRPTDLGDPHPPAGPADAEVAEGPVVAGPAADLVAWLTGRCAGAALVVRPEGPLPQIGAWR